MVENKFLGHVSKIEELPRSEYGKLKYAITFITENYPDLVLGTYSQAVITQQGVPERKTND